MAININQPLEEEMCHCWKEVKENLMLPWAVLFLQGQKKNGVYHLVFQQQNTAGRF